MSSPVLASKKTRDFNPNIFLATPEDYVKATERVYHAGGAASFIDLPVVPAQTR